MLPYQVEESRTEMVLQAADLSADRALRKVQLLGGTREAAETCRRFEGLQCCN